MTSININGEFCTESQWRDLHFIMINNKSEDILDEAYIVTIQCKGVCIVHTALKFMGSFTIQEAIKHTSIIYMCSTDLY